MGFGYFKPVTQWSKGEYHDASNKEDDMAVISRMIPLLPDDVGNVPGAAAPLANKVVTRGTILGANDVDVFRITAAPGGLFVRVQLVPEWAKELPGWAKVPVCRTNLDVRIQLANSTRLLGFRNPFPVDATTCPGMAASMTYTITEPGAYFIYIRGTSLRNPMTGYSSYGSVGSYAVTATYTPLAAAGETVADENLFPVGSEDAG
jgi:hypothetical protein